MISCGHTLNYVIVSRTKYLDAVTFLLKSRMCRKNLLYFFFKAAVMGAALFTNIQLAMGT